MPVIYVKLHAIFHENDGHNDLVLLQWDQNIIFGFLCLIKPDFDKITTFEHFTRQSMGYHTVYVSHFWFLSPSTMDS